MIGVYDYTVILTYCSLASAVVGMYVAFDGRTLPAILFLILSGCFDMFDGKVARTKKNRTHEQKRFGVQIDSLTDLCAFCTLPVVIAFSNGLSGWHGVLGAILFVVCGLIRLAYFNVQEELRQDETTETRKEYLGMPVTSIAISLPVVYAVGRGLQDPVTLQILVEAVLYVSAFAFITPIKVTKPKGKGIIGLVLVGAALVAFYLMLIMR